MQLVSVHTRIYLLSIMQLASICTMIYQLSIKQLASLHKDLSLADLA